MKILFILTFAMYSVVTFGQTLPGEPFRQIMKPSKELEKDTSLNVVYANNEINIHKPAIFVNDKFVSAVVLDPNQIERVDVVNDNFQTDNIQYYGQIHIRTKSSYTPKFISLTDLKEKYTQLKNKPVVFMIDGNIINANYDKYLVDENFLLTIIVDKIENTQEKIDLGLIRVLTRSDGNIKNSKEIRIRGMEDID
jgi:hypothetical protein